MPRQLREVRNRECFICSGHTACVGGAWPFFLPLLAFCSTARRKSYSGYKKPTHPWQSGGFFCVIKNNETRTHRIRTQSTFTAKWQPLQRLWKQIRNGRIIQKSGHISVHTPKLMLCWSTLSVYYSYSLFGYESISSTHPDFAIFARSSLIVGASLMHCPLQATPQIFDQTTVPGSGRAILHRRSSFVEAILSLI